MQVEHGQILGQQHLESRAFPLLVVCCFTRLAAAKNPPAVHAAGGFFAVIKLNMPIQLD